MKTPNFNSDDETEDGIGTIRKSTRRFGVPENIQRRPKLIKQAKGVVTGARKSRYYSAKRALKD